MRPVDSCWTLVKDHKYVFSLLCLVLGGLTVILVLKCCTSVGEARPAYS